MNTSGSREQKASNSHHQPITIYQDDHRNTHDFLSKHPGTVVLPSKTPKKTKPPHHQHPAKKHDPKSKTRVIHPSTRTNSPSHPAQNQTSIHTVDSDESNELEDMRYDTESDNESHTSYDSEVQNSFTFHEMTAEHYDPEQDYLTQPETERIEVRPGATNTLETNAPPIDDIVVDPNSFVLQTDAEDGSVTFKASVIFGGEYNLDDYEVIVTHIG
jgi:hypothetical protein